MNDSLTEVEWMKEIIHNLLIHSNLETLNRPLQTKCCDYTCEEPSIRDSHRSKISLAFKWPSLTVIIACYCPIVSQTMGRWKSKWPRRVIMTLLPWSTADRLQQRTVSRRAMYVTLVQIFAISPMACVHSRTDGLRIMHGDIEGVNRTCHEYAPGLPRGHITAPWYSSIRWMQQCSCSNEAFRCRAGG